MVVMGGPKKWMNVLRYSAVAGATLVLVYWLSCWIDTGVPDPTRIGAWVLKHFGYSHFGRFFSPTFILKGVKTVGEVVMGQTWNTAAAVFRGALLMLVAGVWFVKMAKLKRVKEREGRMVLLALAQFAVMSALQMWWLPWSRKLWLPVLIPAVMAFGIAASGATEAASRGATVRRWQWAGVVLAGLLVLFNVRFVGWTQRRDTPGYLAAIGAWTQHSTPADLLITAGDLNGQLMFWEHRPHTLSQDFLYSGPKVKDKFEDVHKAIRERRLDGGQVLVAPAVADYMWKDLGTSSGVSREDVQRFLGEYEWAPAFSYTNDIDGKVTPVYRMVNQRQRE